MKSITCPFIKLVLEEVNIFVIILGTLDTTGLSTNYIITVACPTTETP